MSSKKAIVTLRKPHLPRDSLYENMGDDYIQITTILFWILAFTFKITHDKMIRIKNWSNNQEHIAGVHAMSQFTTQMLSPVSYFVQAS